MTLFINSLSCLHHHGIMRVVVWYGVIWVIFWTPVLSSSSKKRRSCAFLREMTWWQIDIVHPYDLWGARLRYHDMMKVSGSSGAYWTSFRDARLLFCTKNAFWTVFEAKWHDDSLLFVSCTSTKHRTCIFMLCWVYHANIVLTIHHFMKLVSYTSSKTRF